MSTDNLKSFSLANGMTFFCRRNPANPTVSMSLRSSAGSLADPFDKFGLSGFAASLITKGTSKKSARDLAEEIDSLGVEMGFSAGKHTSVLSARMLSDMLPKALMLMTEILSDPQPNAEEMERMRMRILTGIQMKLDDPAAIATDKMMEMIYGEKHAYGRPFIATLSTVPNITLDEIHSYYRDRILPGSFIGVIVGDIDLETIEKTVTSALGSWKGGGEFSLTQTDLVELPDKPESISIAMPGKTQSDVALGFQGIRRNDPSYYALQVGNTVLGRLSLGGRIGQRVRDKEGMAYYAYTTFDAGIGAGPYLFRAGVNPANIERAVELALEEMAKVKKDGISNEEMEDAIIYLAGGMARQVETNAGMAATIMNQELYGLGDDYYLRFPEILDALTIDDVNNALAQHLHPDHYCLAVAGPEK